MKEAKEQITTDGFDARTQTAEALSVESRSPAASALASTPLMQRRAKEAEVMVGKASSVGQRVVQRVEDESSETTVAIPISSPNRGIIQRVVIQLGNGQYFSTVTNQIYGSQFGAQQAEFAHLEGANVQAPAQTPPAQTPPVQTPPVQTPPAQTPPAQTPPAQTPPAQTPQQMPIFGKVPPPDNLNRQQRPNITRLLQDREKGRITRQEFQQVVQTLELEDRATLQNYPQLANIPHALDFLG